MLDAFLDQLNRLTEANLETLLCKWRGKGHKTAFSSWGKYDDGELILLQGKWQQHALSV